MKTLSENRDGDDFFERGLAGSFSAPGPDAAEGEFSWRRLVWSKLSQLLRIEGGAECLEQLDQVLVAVGEVFNDERVLVDVVNQRAAGFDADAVGGIEASSLGLEHLSNDVRL